MSTAGSTKRIGALIIGQSPRPDLVAPVMRQLPRCELLQAGALDQLTTAALPDVAGTAYPLTTRMRTGESVMVAESFVAQRLQSALEELEGAGVQASILLCAGTFAELDGKRPLVKPFEVGLEIVRQHGFTTIGLIAPFKEQEKPIRARWKQTGLTPSVWTANIAQQDDEFQRQLDSQIQNNNLQCVILDYVGHPETQVNQLRAISPAPVFDLGNLAIKKLADAVQA